MASINSVDALLQELRSLIKASSIARDTATSAKPSLFSTGVPAVTTLRFSLPDRCAWVSLQCDKAILYAYQSAASNNFLPLAAATVLTLNGPLDLSGFSLQCLAANSGGTVSAWVQRSPDATT